MSYALENQVDSWAHRPLCLSRASYNPPRDSKKINLKKGDLVTFVETESGVVIKPAEVIVTEALDEIGRALKEKGISLEEMIARSREMCGEMIEEEYGIVDSQSQ